MLFLLEEMFELDWVVVWFYVFDECEKYKFVFIVVWNEIEGKFVIICYNWMV